MENASKALIIAGAILIAILLIGVGMMILNSTDNITGEVGNNMNAQQLEAFNREFTNYSGPQKGTTVKGLMSKIAASNASHEAQVSVTWQNAESTTDAIISNVTNSKSYTVTITTTAGRVSSIDIT